MRRNAFRLSARHQFWLHGTIALLFLSGVLWLVFHQYLRAHGDFGETANPAEPWFLKAHGAGAMLFLLLLGTVLPGHVRRAWHARRNRFTGAVFLGVNGLLIITGYGLYYFGGEKLRPVVSALHWIVGLLFPLVLIWHIRAGRKLR